MQMFSKNISVLFVGFLALVSLSLNGQSAMPAEAVSTKYEAENAGWVVNLDDAYALSKKTGKPIMANFTGSDWCGWCKKLTASVFSKQEFKDWAAKNVILLELDYPRYKAIPENIRNQNASLQQAFQVQGYPTVWLFDIEKNESMNNYNVSALGKTGYLPTVAEFTSGVDQMLLQRKKP